jgi:hypothetical protein
MRRLDVLDTPIDVVLGGGVVTARHPLLMDSVGGMLSAAAPHAVMRVVTVPLVVGAALLGLDHVGADLQAGTRLRDSYAPA